MLCSMLFRKGSRSKGVLIVLCGLLLSGLPLHSALMLRPRSSKQNVNAAIPLGSTQVALDLPSSQVAQQTEQMRSGKGFIAALDQSGGSTPKALKLYGIELLKGDSPPCL